MSRKITKKIVRIALIVIGALIALDLLVVALIFVPPIQQKIVDVVTEKLSDKLQSRISVDKIYLSPTLKLNAEGFTIYDHRDEPMISAGKLQSRLIGLDFNPMTVSLDDTKGENVKVVLHKYFGDASINIAMWAQKLKKDKKEKKTFILKIKSIDLTDTYFVLIDDKKRIPNNHTDIDYAFFGFKDISWHLDDFLLNGSDISAHFDRMSYNQYTGFQLLNLTGDFKIGAHGMELNDAVLVTPSSHLFLDLAFEYDNWSDYGEFLDSVKFHADLRPSTFDMGTLQYFATATRGMDDTIVVSCKVDGPVNDLHVTDLKANFKDNTQLAGDISMKNIPDFFNAEIHMHLPQNQIDLKEVALFRLPKGKAIPVPPVIQKMGLAVVDIDFDGFVRDGFDARIALKSGAENITAQLVTQNNESTGRIGYNALISTSGIDLGELLNRRDLFGRIVMNATADGSVDMSDFKRSLSTNLNADIQRIDFKRYPLRNLHVQGRYSERMLNGEISVKDPACSLKARTKLNFSRSMPEYWLSARIDSLSASRIFGNIAPVDSATAKGLDKFVYYVQHHPTMSIRADSIGCNLYGNSLKALSGNVFIDKLAYSQDDYTLESDRVRLVVLNDGSSQIYRFTSDLMNAGIATNYDAKEIPNALIDIAYNYCGNLLPDRKARKGKENEDEMKFLDLDLSINEIQPILQIFVPALQLAEGTTAKISSTSIHDNDKIDIRIPRLSVNDKVIIDQIMVDGEQQDSGVMQVMASVSSVAVGKEGALAVSDISLNSLVGNNELGAQLSWQNPEGISNMRSQIGGTVDFPSQKHITVQVKNSDIYFKDYLFHFNDDNLIEIKGNTVGFDNLVLGDGTHQISINGRIHEGDDSLVCLAENVDLDVVNQLLKSQKMTLLGDLSANAQMRTFRGNRVIFGSAIIRDFEFNNEKFGNLYASAAVPTGDKVLFQGGFIMPEYFPENANIQNYTFRTFQNQDHVHIRLNGNYVLKEKALRVTADIDTLRLGFLSPFLSSFSHVMEGDASGKIDFVMNADSLYFDGKAFVRQAKLGIRPLNTVYTIEGQTIDFDKEGFTFNNVVMKDKYGNSGSLQGYIHHNKFNDFDLNLAIKTGRLLVLNTVQKTDNPFYGDAFVSGDVAIFGNMDKLYFAGNNLRTERGTRFGLPISFADKVSDSDVITFKTRTDDDWDNGPEENQAEKSEMEMDFNFILDVTPVADILLDLDLSAFGGSIKTSGDGKLHFTYNTKSDINLTGDVRLHSGSFIMNFMGLISKKFELVEGGNVTFPGSIDDIRINVRAAYSTSASLADILNTENTTQRRVPVKTYLNFNGTLNDPAAIDFSFDLPNATSETKTLFFSAIDTNNLQKRTEQFFSLVMLDRFVSNNSTLDVQNTNLGNTGINVITNTLSNFISKQLKYVDVNFKYQNANEEQAAQYSVSASTSLFNDRTVIEGYFGYVDDKEMHNTNTQFIGDFSIEQKLNEQGNWRVKIFNVTNQDELRNATHNNPYAQGVAVIYKQDFNNRQDLADSFKRNKEKKRLKKNKKDGE